MTQMMMVLVAVSFMFSSIVANETKDGTNFAVYNLTDKKVSFYIDFDEFEIDKNQAVTKNCDVGDIIQIVYQERYQNFTCGDTWRIEL